jgi:unsaturated chondroitin disaccharide hydrolase
MTSTAPRLAASSSANVVEIFDFDRAYAVCADKSRRNLVRLGDRPISGAFARDGNYFAFPEGFFDIGNWTSSFFTGMALLDYEVTRDVELLKQANRLAPVYRDEVTRYRLTTMHDLGFVYSLYSVALYQLTGGFEHRETALLAADELAWRYKARGCYIRAWGRMDERGTPYDGLAIIDCMINLPLLFWAERETGSNAYCEIAVQHSETTQSIHASWGDYYFMEARHHRLHRSTKWWW